MKPVLQALLLADRIYEDKSTGKKIVAGIFHRLFFQKPAKTATIEKDGDDQRLIPGGLQAGSPYAYVSLTDVRGTRRFALRYVYLDDDQVILKLDFEVSCDDPLQTVEIVVPLPSLPTPNPGTYALELLCEDEPIGSFRVKVEEIPTEDLQDGNN